MLWTRPSTRCFAVYDGEAANRVARRQATGNVMIQDDDNEPLCQSSALTQRVGRLMAAALVALTFAHPAAVFAQSGVPGLVVTTTAPPPGPSMAAPPPAAPAPSAPAAKPKPKPSAKKEAAAATGSLNDGGPAAQGIVALVNDEPITAYELHQRAQFMTLTSDFGERAKANMKAIAENPKTSERMQEILKETIAANPGKSREQVIAAFEERKKAFVVSLQQQAVASAKSSMLPGLKKKALDELIEERLKLQEAKKTSVTITDDEVEKSFKGVAERNKMTADQFVAHIKAQGADASVMKARFKASFAWREVIRRRFGHQINVSSRDVDRIAAAATSTDGDVVELQLHKIALGTTGKSDQTILAQSYTEAETLRQKFTGCKNTAALVKGNPNARFEDLGFRKASTLAEPTKSILLSASNGEMVPAILTGTGAELYAVCGRRTAKVDDQKRQAAENELQMKEFERLAQRHLADLRKDALIEMR